MTIALINFGSVARSEQVNPIIRLLSGTAGTTHSVQLIQQDHATNPTLTLRNIHATGTALSVKDSNNTETVRIKNYESATDGDIQVINLQSSFGRFDFYTSGITDAYRADTHHHTVMANYFYDNQYAAGGLDLPDVATMGVQGHQTVGCDAYFRALEVDMISKATVTGTWPKVGIELSIESAAVGNGIDQTVGLSIKNMGTLWIGAGAASKIVDSAIMVGADSHGFTNLIHYRDTAGAGAGLIYKVDSGGDVYSGDLYPRANATYTLGTTTTGEWLAAYVRTYVATGTGVAFSFNGGATTGFKQVATDAIGVVTNSVERGRIDAAGNWITAPAAVATNATDGFLCIAECNGTPTGTPTIASGRGQLVIDYANHKLYFHDGSAWIAVN